MGLDTVDFLMHLERRFDLEIPDAAAAKIETIGQLKDYISAELQRKGQNMPSERILEEIKHILVREFAVKENQIRLDSRIAADLGLE